MALEIQEKDNRFRVIWQGNSTDWLPDTPSNRKAALVFLHSLILLANSEVEHAAGLLVRLHGVQQTSKLHVLLPRVHKS